MSAVVQHVLTALGAVIGVGGGIAAVSYALLRFFGEKWLGAKFEERLAAYKHTQQKELEELRFNINALMDRAIKLHQKEFEVLPEAWGRLVEAFGTMSAVTSVLQRYPDLDTIREPQLDEFLENSPLANWEKDELKATTGRTEYYKKAIRWHNFFKARRALMELNIFLLKNGIFIPEPMKSRFSEIERLISNAVIEYEFNEQHGLLPRRSDDRNKLNASGTQLMESLEKEVQNRLWDSQRV